jgi:hypothetical protein
MLKALADPAMRTRMLDTGFDVGPAAQPGRDDARTDRRVALKLARLTLASSPPYARPFGRRGRLLPHFASSNNRHANAEQFVSP